MSKVWMSEDPRQSLFDVAALGLTHYTINPPFALEGCLNLYPFDTILVEPKVAAALVLRYPD